MNLCEACRYRAESRRRVEERKGRPILDPAPRAECKLHEGYGVEPAESLARCRDFEARGDGGEQ